jgi:hypothetical protein
LKVKAPLLSLAEPRTLPLLASVKVTMPVAIPLAACTRAVNVTQESWVTDVADDVSAVVVLTPALSGAAPALAGASTAVMATAQARTVRVLVIMAVSLGGVSAPIGVGALATNQRPVTTVVIQRAGAGWAMTARPGWSPAMPRPRADPGTRGQPRWYKFSARDDMA